jgi:thiamine kinase-like enzyme
MIQPPLSRKPDHVAMLCDALGLGAPHGELSGVAGGFHHRMWRLETDRGVYAVKQLGADIDVTDPDVLTHYNVTEMISEAFAANGVSAIHALSRRSIYLQIIENVGYLVYPWTEAVALERKNLSEQHAIKIAQMLAKMHRANIHVADLKDIPVEYHPEEKIIALTRWATASHARDCQELATHLPMFLDISARRDAARQVLRKNRVVSHGDLDQKNVLWSSSEEPILIDWESARRLNPTYEAVLIALDWSGITSAFEPVLFEKFIAAYKQAGGVVEDESLEAAFQCALGDWLDWLMFNVGRSFDTEDMAQRSLGAEQVDLALSTLLRLQRFSPRLVSRFREPAAAAAAGGDSQCLT